MSPSELNDRVDRASQRITQQLHLRKVSDGLDADWIPGAIRPYLLALAKPLDTSNRQLEQQVKDQKKLIALYEKLMREILPKLSIEGVNAAHLGRIKNQIHRIVELEKGNCDV